MPCKAAALHLYRYFSIPGRKAPLHPGRYSTSHWHPAFLPRLVQYFAWNITPSADPVLRCGIGSSTLLQTQYSALTSPLSRYSSSLWRVQPPGWRSTLRWHRKPDFSLASCLQPHSRRSISRSYPVPNPSAGAVLHVASEVRPSCRHSTPL
jgi:hypothetical protein